MAGGGEIQDVLTNLNPSFDHDLGAPRQSVLRHFSFCGLRNRFVMSRSQTRLMSTQIETARVRRTLRDKLLLWRRAFETKIFDEHREAIGRGPTVEASREAALAVWVTDGQREFETVRDNPVTRNRPPINTSWGG